MHAFRMSVLPGVAAATALTIISAVALAETAAEVPKNSYMGDPLSMSERSGIAQEENVTPNDGRASVPDAPDDGVIPDAAIDQRAGAAQGPAPTDENLGKRKGVENEAEAVIQDSKRNYKVTKKDIAGCMKDWGPQTQMTREEWAASCRTTLEYFPDGAGQ